MTSVGMEFSNEGVVEYLKQLEDLFGPQALHGILVRWGEYLVGRAKARFGAGGPGWPPKNAMFAYWEGGRNAPLHYQGHLLQSLTSDIPSPGVLRVGSPLRYAATQNFGSQGVRKFIVWILPEYEKSPFTESTDESGTVQQAAGVTRTKAGGFRRRNFAGDAKRGYRIARFDNGYPKGKLVTEGTVGAIPVLVRITVQARPFLVEPDAAEEAELIRIAGEYTDNLGGSKPGRGTTP